ncbi:hypothetical protein F5X99DRAFT_403818 [Biscogniauxia marginata]|nr:hypothetical protein F5X99DRAFT_403818 [Biscogniauxia marginata]
MFWQRFARIFAWLLLANYISAFPSSLEYRSDSDDDDEKVVIGYRSCNKIEAQALQRSVYRDTRFDQPAARLQLGYGLYTSPSPGEYKADGDWIVVFYMDKDVFESLPKIWIPATYGGNAIWESEQAVANYIAQHTDVDPENRGQALRLAPFSTDKNKLQMLIPTHFANNHGGLITAKAAEKIEDLPERGRVNYDDWDNVKGDRTDPAAGGGNNGSDSDSDDD